MNTKRGFRSLTLSALCWTLAIDASGCGPSDRTGSTTEPEAPVRAATTSRAWNFDDIPPGSLPAGFAVQVGEWGVERESEAPDRCCVVIQKATSPSAAFNLLLVDTTSLADLDISVRLRARLGDTDQGGGGVWRARDPSNYYIARYNPLEENYRVYVVRDGARHQLDSARVRLDPRAWHVLRVRMIGDHVECFLDGTKHLDVRDGTFAQPGSVGLWTKADARTEFDDLQVDGFDATGQAPSP